MTLQIDTQTAPDFDQTRHSLDTDHFRRYYDTHPTEEDLLADSVVQTDNIMYLTNVLLWYYHEEGWFVIPNLNLYRTRNYREKPVAPDIAIFTGLRLPPARRRRLKSWYIKRPERPAPTVVIEFSSEETWRQDVLRDKKPQIYADWGIGEYYAYDPNDPQVWDDTTTRLRGWHNDRGAAIGQLADPRGRLWSPALESWLVPDGEFLRLFSWDGSPRLTHAEWASQRVEYAEMETIAERQFRVAAQAAAEAERKAKERAQATAQSERAAKEAAQAVAQAAQVTAQAAQVTAQAAQATAQAERAAKEAAWARLRELGIDPTRL